MHDQLSELLQREVVGRVTEVGGVFFDVALGRLCLERLDRRQIEQIVATLVARYGEQTDVFDQLFVEEPERPLRGRVDVTVRDPETGAPYVLQISSKTMLAFHERRFALGPELLGDLTGTIALGIEHWLAKGFEGPFRQLSGYDELRRRYLEQQERALQASIAGSPLDVVQVVAELADPVRRAWALVPWSARSQLAPTFTIAEDRIARADRSHRRTILFAADVIEGEVVYRYVHQHVAGERYEQVQGWLSDIYNTMLDAYQPPAHEVTLARASSIETFADHFPGFRRVVGPPGSSAGPAE